MSNEEESPGNNNVIAVDFTRARTPKAMKVAQPAPDAKVVDDKTPMPNGAETKLTVFSAMIADSMVMVRVCARH